jgi:RNA polymerase sigma-70 factor (ECF subfamily)
LFTHTHWSAILPSGPTGEASLEAVYAAYQRPLVLYLLYLRYSPHDAADLVQGFFADLLRRNALASVSREKGRFRTFLISSLKHYLSDQRDRRQAAKRGGGQALLSLEELLEQQGIDHELVSRHGPDWAYDKAWADMVLSAAMRQLDQEITQVNKRALYAALLPVIHRDVTAVSYQEIAQTVGMTEGAVKVAAKRLRDRLRHLIREQVRQTISNPAELEDELRYLIELLGQK